MVHLFSKIPSKLGVMARNPRKTKEKSPKGPGPEFMWDLTSSNEETRKRERENKGGKWGVNPACGPFWEFTFGFNNLGLSDT